MEPENEQIVILNSIVSNYNFGFFDFKTRYCVQAITGVYAVSDATPAMSKKAHHST